MFKTRLLSGILLVIIALITLITGGNLLFAVLLAISLIGLTESSGDRGIYICGALLWAPLF